MKDYELIGVNPVVLPTGVQVEPREDGEPVHFRAAFPPELESFLVRIEAIRVVKPAPKPAAKPIAAKAEGLKAEGPKE